MRVTAPTNIAVAVFAVALPVTSKGASVALAGTH